MQMLMRSYVMMVTIIAKELEHAFLMNIFVMEQYNVGPQKKLEWQKQRYNMLWQIEEEMMKI